MVLFAGGSSWRSGTGIEKLRTLDENAAGVP